ncbi:MAG: hypothetical protein KTR31_36900 [Myxococcales bacterium]|nr:hypothetical protein [Myxococcales bacterium]
MQRVVLGAWLLSAFACRPETGLTPEPPPVGVSEAKPLDPVTQIDTITQVTNPVVDVLWTIDNSCSMRDEQKELTGNFPTFMGYFTDSGLDYHVGVIATDMDNPELQGKLRASKDGAIFIDPKTIDPEQVFTTMATLGTDGSGIERGLGAIFTALELFGSSFNAGFFRYEASIHTIVISDEPDSTDGSTISQKEFIAWYGGLKEKRSDRTFSSIVSPASSGPYDGSNYLAVTDEIGGIPWDINRSDWDRVLDRLGVQAAGLKREYFLSRQPVPGTVEVAVHEPVGDDQFAVVEYLPIEVDGEGNVVSGDWIYNQERNSILFLEYVPEPLSRVVLTYTLLASTERVTDG